MRSWSHIGRCRSSSVCGVKTQMLPNYTTFQMRSSGRAELELVGLKGKALSRDATGRLRFDVNAAGWLLLLARLIKRQVVVFRGFGRRSPQRFYCQCGRLRSAVE